MAWIILLIVIAVVAWLALKGTSASPGKIGFPYRPNRSLFSAAERSFLGVLDRAVGVEHRVFGKVRVADVAAVNPGLNASVRQGALNRIAAKHFDFIVCRASDLVIVCAVELNDRSHANAHSRKRDELIANVCRTIALPLLTIPAKAGYSLEELRMQFLEATQHASAVLPTEPDGQTRS
jgi:hypothetical protein